MADEAAQPNIIVIWICIGIGIGICVERGGWIKVEEAELFGKLRPIVGDNKDGMRRLKVWKWKLMVASLAYLVTESLVRSLRLFECAGWNWEYKQAKANCRRSIWSWARNSLTFPRVATWCDCMSLKGKGEFEFEYEDGVEYGRMAEWQNGRSVADEQLHSADQQQVKRTYRTKRRGAEI
ncbi:uncharacterized protein EAF02_004791 [Botrytis sinoallii]|uniref:uncharacterized protein n=1 Tax=Botrytis sinoallii TaxID=1463999 RepID=UPI001900F58C|nr:uncharacterized protein EAF02_004791 [Botrytis sinoallii]KAF7884455.1 hypothetical protein EAF02_004791 [Botrytis sinoallii]